MKLNFIEPTLLKISIFLILTILFLFIPTIPYYSQVYCEIGGKCPESHRIYLTPYEIFNHNQWYESSEYGLIVLEIIALYLISCTADYSISKLKKGIKKN